MREIRTAQRSIFEPEPVDHDIAKELEAISDWLDRHPALLQTVAEDLNAKSGRCDGRHGLAVDAALRCALLKQYRQVSYRELVFLLTD